MKKLYYPTSSPVSIHPIQLNSNVYHYGPFYNYLPVVLMIYWLVYHFDSHLILYVLGGTISVAGGGLEARVRGGIEVRIFSV